MRTGKAAGYGYAVEHIRSRSSFFFSITEWSHDIIKTHFKNDIREERHIGRFVSGELGGRQVLVMQGRLHVYEGYTMEDVAYPIRVAKLLGIDKLVITNNAGGINKSFCPGDLMIITDYIKFAPGGPPQRVSSGPFPGAEPHVFCKAKPVKLKKVAFSHFFDTL